MGKLLAYFCLAVLPAVASAGSYYQFEKKLSAAEQENLGLREVSYGLSEEQLQSLYALSGGKADLRFTYESRHSLRSSGGSFLGSSRQQVPPPGFYAPADPDLVDQWWIKQLEVPQAWDQATGKGVTIADCDSGFYVDEPDIHPNLLLDHRFDLADKNNPFRVDDGNFISHGTSVAAIMVGALDGSGTNGIAYNAKVVPLQNFNYDSKLDDLDKEEATARCILRAITIPDVKIIVLENQTGEGSSETFAGTRAAVRLALASGITIVSAGGNYYKKLKIEAEDDTGSIIVGALDSDDSKSSFSNHGERITVAAYGRDLKTLSGPKGAMGSFGGTSGATPQVAAGVALMLETNPNLLPKQIREILEETRITTEKNKSVGGRLNILEALKRAKETRVSSYSTRQSQMFRKDIRSILSSY